jgi:crotonobetainyl-CoA:carnitine CoA-transferase CaiB-like acyl-CoA transferase
MAIESLQGVRVAAFTQFLLGPIGVQYLADLGADVIKIESPGLGAWERHWSGAEGNPDGVSTFFLLANRNVRSVALNLKNASGIEVAQRLIAGCDVVVENFRPGVMDRLGLGFEEARRLRSDIIYVSASGFGRDSAYRDLPGQDLVIQAMSGLAWLTGSEDGPPVPAGAAVVDQHGGALLALGTMAALLHRERTGQGQQVEIVMTSAALDLATEPFVYFLNGKSIERPGGHIADTFHEFPYGIYRTLDGFTAISMATLAAVYRALGEPEELASCVDASAAFSDRYELSLALGRVTAQYSNEQLVRTLRAGGVWCAPVNDLGRAFADRAMGHEEAVLEFEYPGTGTVRVLKHPVKYSVGGPELRRLPPQLGEHNGEVLSELGYSAAEVAELVSAGALENPRSP